MQSPWWSRADGLRMSGTWQENASVVSFCIFSSHILQSSYFWYFPASTKHIFSCLINVSWPLVCILHPLSSSYDLIDFFFLFNNWVEWVLHWLWCYLAFDVVNSKMMKLFGSPEEKLWRQTKSNNTHKLSVLNCPFSKRNGGKISCS